MDTAKCKAFVTAAETGSFSAAAERLHYTPSGVSQLVTALERELDLTLLHRTRQGVRLTASGEQVIGAVRTFLQQAERVEQLAAELNDLHTGTITIASYPSMTMRWLPSLLEEFGRMYPNIRIHLREGERREFVEWLHSGEVDLAFLARGDLLEGDWLPLADDPIVALLPKNHPMAGEEAFPIDRLKEERFIMGCQGLDTDTVELLRSYGVEPKVFYSTVNGISVLPMVEHGLGISVMNALISTCCPFEGVKLPLDPPHFLTLGILVPNLEEAPPAARRFIDFAVRRLTQEE